MTHTLPPGWEEKKLEDIVSVLNGLWTGKKPPYCQAFVIRSTNFTKDCRLDLADVANLQVEQRQFDNRELKKGDILVEKSGGGPKQPVGRVVLFDKTERGFSFSNFTSVLRIKNPTIISYYFLYWLLYFCYLSGKTIPMQKYTTGIRNLQMSEYKELKVSLPSLVEQKRIVEKLDKIFAAIDKAKSQTEKNLQNVGEIFETTLRSCFAQGRHLWPQKRLDEVCTDFGRGKSKHRPRNDVSLYGGKYPFIQTGDIRSASHKITSYHQTYNEKGLQQSKLWPKGTLCITIAANIAETAILDFDACFPDSVIGCIFNPNLADVSYAEYLLHAFRAILQKESKGSAQANINLGTFERQTFPFPLISEQKQIVEKLDILQSKTKELEKIYTQKLADLEELKQAVLQQAFSGKL